MGCKDAELTQEELEAIRFTLTMWDVKIFIKEVKKKNERCFTLTMWDVKGLSSVGEIPQYTVLP